MKKEMIVAGGYHIEVVNDSSEVVVTLDNGESRETLVFYDKYCSNMSTYVLCGLGLAFDSLDNYTAYEYNGRTFYNRTTGLFVGRTFTLDEFSISTFGPIQTEHVMGGMSQDERTEVKDQPWFKPFAYRLYSTNSLMYRIHVPGLELHAALSRNDVGVYIDDISGDRRRRVFAPLGSAWRKDAKLQDMRLWR